MKVMAYEFNKIQFLSFLEKTFILLNPPQGYVLILNSSNNSSPE
jgi:hypothetical protein